MQPSGGRFFSKRADASLRRPSFQDVWLIPGPFQVATSIRTRVVPSWTSLRSPPITPAIDVGPSASSITPMRVSSVRT